MIRLILILTLASSAEAAYRPVSHYDSSVEDVFVSGISQNDLSSLEYDEEKFARHVREFRSRFSFHLNENYTVSVNLEEVGEWDILFALNFQALEVMRTIRSCPDVTRPIALAYAKDLLCPEARDRLKDLRLNVQSFLVSTQVDDFSFAQRIHCQLRDERKYVDELHSGICSDFQRSKLDKVWLMAYIFNGFPLEKPDYEPVHQMPLIASQITALGLPTFHPLLVQVMLEVVAVGYFLPWGDYSCGGLFCLKAIFIPNISAFPERKSSGRMILGTGPVEWLANGYREDRGIVAQRFTAVAKAKELLEGGALPSASDFKGEFAELLLDVRASMAGLRWLQVMSFGMKDRNHFGLWPERSTSLMTTLAASAVWLDGGQKYFPTLADRVLFRWRSLATFDIPYIRISGGAQDDLAIDHLADVGAWRKLYYQTFEESPTPRAAKPEWPPFNEGR